LEVFRICLISFGCAQKISANLNQLPNNSDDHWQSVNVLVLALGIFFCNVEACIMTLYVQLLALL